MYFKPFFHDYPNIAAVWTRQIAKLDPETGAVIVRYSFSPTFCMDKKCDCRRAMINVYKNEDANNLVGVLSFGWESMAYYKKVMGNIPMESLVMFKGPAVDRYQPHRPEIFEVLEDFVQLLKDKEYVERIKTQYLMAKRKQKMKPAKDMFLNTMMPCPCRSGVPFRICCGK